VVYLPCCLAKASWRNLEKKCTISMYEAFCHFIVIYCVDLKVKITHMIQEHFCHVLIMSVKFSGQ